MARERRRLYVNVPEPNKNITMASGNKVLADAVFWETESDPFLDGLKRSQGKFRCRGDGGPGGQLRGDDRIIGQSSGQDVG